MSNPLIALFANEPAMVEPTLSERFESSLAQAAKNPHLADMLAETVAAAGDDYWPSADSWAARFRPYVVKDGILQIPVRGVLLHNFPWQDGQWATGYEYIWRAFERGCGDFATGAIKGIALLGDTPGGMVAGCFDTVDRMIALKEKVGVPVWGFAHEGAYSAGYAVFMVADKIAVSRTGGVGSIGVVTSHTDASGLYEKIGLKITFIASDASKVEGNSTEAPSKAFLQRTQDRIMELYSVFVSAVARGRGLEESFIRDTLKAYCFTAAQAVSNGLADSVGSLEDATSAFADSLDEPSDNGEDEMTTQVETVDKAVHEQAVTTAKAEGEQAGASAMQERIGAILGSEEAKGREDLAKHFAFKTGMSAEDAKAALAAAPKTVAAAPEGKGDKPETFAEAMDTTKNPEIGADGGKKDDEKAEDGSDVLRLVRAAGIGGFVPAQAK